MTDLIERLRDFEGSDGLGNGDFSLLSEAAAEIERLRAEKVFSRSREQILNSTLPFGQEAHELAYSVPGATLAGIVDGIRTSLVELVADLTAGLDRAAAATRS